MKKRVLKKIALLAAPIIWRRIRGRRARHPWHRHRGWHGRHHRFGQMRQGHKRHGIWL
jgi:hypothetical protein